MEISLLKELLGNTSSFLNLSSFENINSELVQKFYQRSEEILKLLKPILSAVIDSEITSDKVLGKALEGLSLPIEELREQFESWQPLLSKVYFAVGLFLVLLWIRCLSKHHVVEWESGKEGCTMHVSPDQLWPHTKLELLPPVSLRLSSAVETPHCAGSKMFQRLSSPIPVQSD
ncbi:hypothetical protein Gotur_001033 [Gossypium turneri]